MGKNRHGAKEKGIQNMKSRDYISKACFLLLAFILTVGIRKRENMFQASASSPKKEQNFQVKKEGIEISEVTVIYGQVLELFYEGNMGEVSVSGAEKVQLDTENHRLLLSYDQRYADQKAYVEITSSETEEYLEKTIQMPITYKKRRLKITKISAPEKIYDKTKKASIQEFSLEGLAACDLEEIVKESVCIQGEYEDDQAGIQKGVAVTAAFQGEKWRDKYELEEVEPITGTILPKTVRLTVSGDYSAPYTEFDENAMREEVSVGYKKEDVIQGDEKEIASMPLPKAAIMGEIPRVEDGQPCMTAKEGLSVIGIETGEFEKQKGESYWKQIQTEGNYQFIFYEQSKANLIITPQKIDLTFIRHKKSSGTFQDSQVPEIFWMGQGGTLRMEPGDKKHYEYVAHGSQKKNLTDKGLEYEEVDGDLFIYLRAKQPSNGIALEPDARIYSQGLQIQVNQDSAAPRAEISIGLEDVPKTEAANDVTFGVFDQKVGKARVRIEDYGEDQQKKRGSGVASVSYTVWEFKEDQDTPEQIREKMAESLWKPLAYREGEEILIEEYVTSLPRECNYAVLVKTVDHVGNCMVYCSSGAIADITPPAIDIQLEGQKKGDDLYCGDVNALVTVTDPVSGKKRNVFSGLEKVTYQIIRNGEIQESGSFKEQGIDGTLKNVRLRDISKRAKATKSIPIRKEYNSNDIRIKVEAKDQAGNTFSCSKSLKIDISPPEVSISFQSRAKPQNEIYFSSNRRAIVTVRERNFDPQEVKFYLKREDQPSGVYTLSQLEKQLGIRTRWVDSQEEVKDEKKHTDDRIHRAEILFQGEDRYEFAVARCRDLAEWEHSGTRYQKKKDPANQTFVIDKTAPILQVVYVSGKEEIKPGKSEKKRVYRNKTITANIAVLEHNFSSQKKKARVSVQAKLEARDSGKKAKIPDVNQVLKNPGLWTSHGDRNQITLRFTQDSNYAFSMECTDLAGNRAVYKKAYFTVDKTKPAGTISIGDLGEWKNFHSKAAFGIFQRKRQKVTLTGQDDTSKIKQISYYKSERVLKKSQVKKIRTWKRADSFWIKPQEQAMIYARIEDLAGNVTYISSEGVVLDDIKPTLNLLVASEKPVSGIFNGDVKVNISVADSVSGCANSGLSSVSYQVWNQDKMTQSGSFDEILSAEATPVDRLNSNITIDSEKNNSNKVRIKVTAVDNAGNASSKEENLKIDVTSPKISIVYEESDSGINGFYNHSRIAKITIRERNFDPEKVSFSIKSKNGEKPVIRSWNISPQAGRSDEARNTCTISFHQDGDYEFTLNCTDQAGNKGDYGQTDVFTIDKTAPKIIVTYDENEKRNQRYYSEKRRATVTIKERNFQERDVKVLITAKSDGKEAEAPVIGTFRKNGDIHTAVICFEKDADYAFSIACKDRAGNESVSGKTQRFTVDTKRPDIAFFGMKKSNNGKVAPVITFMDENLDADGWEITLEGYTHPIKKVTGKISIIGKGQSILLEDFPYTKEADDIYTLRARASDKAGNRREASCTFSVNRFGSVYTMDQNTKNLLETYYSNKIEDVRIRETNVDALIFKEITCSRDGEVITLREGEDYTVEEKKHSDGWKVYDYRIFKETFQKEGAYAINLYSEDGADNRSSNQAKGKELAFVIDKTAPTLVITGVENNRQYQKESVEITVDAKDNIQLESVKIEAWTEGEKDPRIYEFTGSQLQKDYGVIKKKIASADQWQILKISAIDRAGNTGETKELRILITRNLWIQFYRNKPLFYGAMAGIFIIISITANRWKRRIRKKKVV